jgi:hypothetical protein
VSDPEELCRIGPLLSNWPRIGRIFGDSRGKIAAVIDPSRPRPPAFAIPARLR